eukprot:scaffold23659_cov36-Tisochrysis_lutea.AAC.2
MPFSLIEGRRADNKLGVVCVQQNRVSHNRRKQVWQEVHVGGSRANRATVAELGTARLFRSKPPLQFANDKGCRLCITTHLFFCLITATFLPHVGRE